MSLVSCARVGHAEPGAGRPHLSVEPKRVGAKDGGQAKVGVCGSRSPEPRPWWRSRRAEEGVLMTVGPGRAGLDIG